MSNTSSLSLDLGISKIENFKDSIISEELSDSDDNYISVFNKKNKLLDNNLKSNHLSKLMYLNDAKCTSDVDNTLFCSMREVIKRETVLKDYYRSKICNYKCTIQSLQNQINSLQTELNDIKQKRDLYQNSFNNIPKNDLSNTIDFLVKFATLTKKSNKLANKEWKSILIKFQKLFYRYSLKLKDSYCTNKNNNFSLDNKNNIDDSNHKSQVNNYDKAIQISSNNDQFHIDEDLYVQDLKHLNCLHANLSKSLDSFILNNEDNYLSNRCRSIAISENIVNKSIKSDTEERIPTDMNISTILKNKFNDISMHNNMNTHNVCSDHSNSSTIIHKPMVLEDQLKFEDDASMLNITPVIDKTDTIAVRSNSIPNLLFKDHPIVYSKNRHHTVLTKVPMNSTPINNNADTIDVKNYGSIRKPIHTINESSLVSKDFMTIAMPLSEPQKKLFSPFKRKEAFIDTPRSYISSNFIKENSTDINKANIKIIYAPKIASTHSLSSASCDFMADHSPNTFTDRKSYKELSTSILNQECNDAIKCNEDTPVYIKEDQSNKANKNTGLVEPKHVLFTKGIKKLGSYINNLNNQNNKKNYSSVQKLKLKFYALQRQWIQLHKNNMAIQRYQCESKLWWEQLNLTISNYKLLNLTNS